MFVLIVFGPLLVSTLYNVTIIKPENIKAKHLGDDSWAGISLVSSLVILSILTISGVFNTKADIIYKEYGGCKINLNDGDHLLAESIIRNVLMYSIQSMPGIPALVRG